MTNRENFIRAIHFDGPERVPLNTCFSHEPYLSMSDCTCYGFGELQPNEWDYQYSKAENDTETLGLVNVHPLKNLDDVLSFNPPAVGGDKRFEGLAKQFEEDKKNDKYTFGCIGTYVFERLQNLIGMEDLFDYIYNEPEAIRAIGDKIVDFQCEMIRGFAKCGADGIWGGDDWGLQDRLMISPVKWRELFKPWYQRLFDTAKEYGMINYMHSCGKNNEIIPDLIELGLDVIELHQPTVYDVDWLSEHAGGKLCFSTTADVQKTLPYGDHAAIEQEMAALKEKLGSFNGGLMYIFYGNPSAIGVSDETCRFFIEMCKKYQWYR